MEEAKKFYEKFKKDKGLNFCEGLDDVFELMTEYSKDLQSQLNEANDRIKEMEKLLTHLRPIHKEDSDVFEKYENQRMGLLKP